MKSLRREAFTEWRFGLMRVQLFDPKLWSLRWPKLFEHYEEQPNPDAQSPWESITLGVKVGWTLALPTMSITRVYRRNGADGV